MAATTRRTLMHTSLAIAAAVALAGCATRFDADGNQIYVWQFGQDTSRGIDRSNPRLPVLPPSRPVAPLWPAPSPYGFWDLSEYSFLAPQSPLDGFTLRVGDNALCGNSCNTPLRIALLAPRADARGDRRAADTR
jgi:hypothetical protein